MPKAREGNLAENLKPESTAPTTVPPEAVSHRRARVLLGWMVEHEAISNLLGRPPELGEDVATQRHIWQAARIAAMARPSFSPNQVLVSRESDQESLDEIAKRPEVAAHFSGMKWRTEMAGL